LISVSVAPGPYFFSAALPALKPINNKAQINPPDFRNIVLPLPVLVLFVFET
jgi:hypothetical protein